MKLKIIIFIFSIIIIATGTTYGILTLGTNSSAASPTIVNSTDIGSQYDPNEVQFKYVSFAPAIPRNQAIATAKEWLSVNFVVDTDNLPADSSVALYSGPVRPPNVSPTGETVKDLPVWVVVIRDVPQIGSGGPPSTRKFKIATQANVTLDASTGKIIYGHITGKRVYLDEQ
jgi:hypothetical protein